MYFNVENEIVFLKKKTVYKIQPILDLLVDIFRTRGRSLDKP